MACTYVEANGEHPDMNLLLPCVICVCFTPNLQSSQDLSDSIIDAACASNQRFELRLGERIWLARVMLWQLRGPAGIHQARDTCDLGSCVQ